MQNNPSIYKDKVQSLWHRYAQKVYESVIKLASDRWMARWVGQYIAAFSDLRLAEQSPAEVERYLKDLGQRPELKEWQFRQAVDAIWILFERAGRNSAADCAG
jgi:hypothetical protein